MLFSQSLAAEGRSVYRDALRTLRGLTNDRVRSKMAYNIRESIEIYADVSDRQGGRGDGGGRKASQPIHQQSIKDVFAAGKERSEMSKAALDQARKRLVEGREDIALLRQIIRLGKEQPGLAEQLFSGFTSGGNLK